jgi:hypothetical protein
MTFEEILDQAIAMLQRRSRLTYCALKRRFNLDGAFLEDLKEELIYGQQLAADEEGKVLVWTGGTDRASAATSPAAFSLATAPQRAPLSYTPAYLTDMRRGSSRSMNTLSSTLSRMRLLMAVCSKSGDGCCMPTSLRSSRRWLAIAWSSRSNVWPTMPCAERCGIGLWHIAGRPGRRR